ncbi:MAG: hypothetical protein ACRYFZ_00960 [Janthinobacterium lividum]
MANENFLVRCGRAVAQNRSFTATVADEQQTIEVETAQQVLDYFDKLNVPTREEFNDLPITNQLQLAATLPLFTA